MKYFVDILKQFTVRQRLIVLILLLSFTTGGVLLSQYFKTDDCRPYIEENFKMHEDFVKISEMLRNERMKENVMIDSVKVSAPADEPTGGSVPVIKDKSIMDSILTIANSHN